MFKNLKWLRLVPDKPGKGGYKAGFHTFQVQPTNDTYITQGCHVYRGRWRRDYQSQYYAGQSIDSGDVQALALHAYTYPNLTDPSQKPSVKILGHNLITTGPTTSHYWDYTTGFTRDSHAATVVPATFLNIEGRCFVGDGGREGMVLDDRTPAIHAQANQNLGIGTPTQPLQATNALSFVPSAPASAVVPNLIGGTLAYTVNNHGGAFDNILHSPDPGSGLGRVQVGDVVTVSLLDPSYTPISGALPAVAAVAVLGTSSNRVADAANPPYTTNGDTISCTSGTSIVTRSGFWPAGAGRVAGLAINFNGYSFMLGATDRDAGADQLDVNGNVVALGAFQAIILGEYDGPTVTNVPFTITGCEVNLAAVCTNTLAVASAGTQGYGQSTASTVVPVLVSASTDRSVWFTESSGNRIGKMTTAGAPTEYLVPTAACFPFCICFGPDGNLWFTEAELLTKKIGKITIGGSISEYAGLTGQPQGICTGPDGNLWFTEMDTAAITRMTPEGVWAGTRYTVGLPVGSQPLGICAGPDGNLWFTDFAKHQIGRCTIFGVITMFSAGITAGATPQFITAGPDGALWFTEPGADKIGRITTSGTVTEYATGITAGATPAGICVGSDANIWFTEPGIDKIGKITMAGVITEYAGLTAFAAPAQIVGGGDGNLWFTELGITKIGTMTTAGLGVVEYGGFTALSVPNGITAAGGYRNLGKMTLSGTGMPISPVPWAGPTYAYAWYDPETGHMSNISPLITLTALPPVLPNTLIQNYQNVTPYFRIDDGYISYPPASPSPDRTRFSHIVFFRTLSTGGSSTLYPIGSLQPFVGKVHPGASSTRGSWNPMLVRGWFGQPNVYVDGLGLPGATANYWYDFSSDEDLILSGGFRAPQFTNEKPMVTLRGGITQPGSVAYQAYWDRRLWVVNTQEPDKIAFSCDEAQCPLGVPVESFPPTNFLRIPSVDGRVVGLKMVGEMLLITTDRWAYTVAGNNESNYRLVRVSARMGGVGTYQMSELTSNVEGQAAVVYFLGRDKIVYEWVPGGSITPISDPVQNVINTYVTTLQQYQMVRVHCVSAWSRRLVVLSFGANHPVAGTSTGRTCLIFDTINRVWTENWTDGDAGGGVTTNVGPAAMATVYGQDPPVDEIFASPDTTWNNVRVWSWLRDDGAVQSTGPFGNRALIYTFPLTFDGLKTRKQLVAVNLHVSADNAPFAFGNYDCTVYSNEVAVGTTVFGQFPDLLYSVYGTGAVPFDGANAQDLALLTAQFTGDAAAVGYRMAIQINARCTATPTEIFAIDIGYVDWQEAGEGDP